MEKTDELRRIRSEISWGGGGEAVKKQHNAGKMTARERLAALFDDGSFIETDAFVKGKVELKTTEKQVLSEGVVCGYGTVFGRLVYAYAQDYTVSRGAFTAAHADKICKILDMALKMGAPVVAVLDSQGAKIEAGIEIAAAMGKILKKTALLSGVVPQISLILGVCAGGAAFVPALSDFVIMSQKNSFMFLNGPSVAGAAELSPEDFGGAEACAVKGGTAHIICKEDGKCIETARELLEYLPSNNVEAAPFSEEEDDINRVSEYLQSVCDDTSSVDVKNIIKEVADCGAFFEASEKYAQNTVTGFISLNGSSVGVIANQSKVSGGEIDVKGAKKAARFLRICDSFNIPVLTVTNTAGFCVTEEPGAVLKAGADLVYAFAEATVPKVNLVVGKASGNAYIAMNSKHLGADVVLAWAGAEISVINSEGAANILYAEEIAKSDNPVKKREEICKNFASDEASPYNAASLGYVDDIIEAASTRQRLVAAFEMLASKRESNPPKKHGNMPL